MNEETELGFWKTALQALKEFWPALVGATLWAGYHLWQLGVIDKTVLIAHWCGAFFFVSFITGNWNRIRHQGDTKSRLRTINKAMERFQDAQKATSDVQEQMMKVVSDLAKQGSETQPLLADLSRMLVTANVQSNSANNAIMDIVQASVSPSGMMYDAGLFGTSRFSGLKGTVTLSEPVYVPEDHLPPKPEGEQ
jgi:hypothetical protein